MKPAARSTPRNAAALLLMACAATLLGVVGCHGTPDAVSSDTGKDKAAGEEPADGVVLTAEEVEKIGLVTLPVKKILHTPEAPGFGVVVAHESIATAVAELRTASAMERQSTSAFARGQRLSGTPGAMPAESQETAERQAAVDRAALELAQRRLSATFGQNPPWDVHGDSAQLAALANGTLKLVRVTFPLGSVGDAALKSVRLSRIAARPGVESWRAASVWSAPADPGVPGKSFFAILKGSDVGEGERLLAGAPVGEADTGVEIPASAVVISNGKYWCYVEQKPGTFVRSEIDPGTPTAEGYFVTEGLAEGDKVVTKSAGLLLARETSPGNAAD